VINSMFGAQKNLQSLSALINEKQHRWLVTGAAGFIGSAIAETLIQLNQDVTILDNLSTGHQRNVDELEQLARVHPQAKFRFIKADIRDFQACEQACADIDYVLHQAALGSVPRSIADPLSSHDSNVNGFINMLRAAEQNKVKHFVYASSSSVYGDSAELPKVESKTGSVLSPYAATKAINELYAGVFTKSYKIGTSGLRYFNVFGRRQDPKGPYAAVIPKWTLAILDGQAIVMNGDGSTSRDFCYVDNAVQANIRSALVNPNEPVARVFNVACGAQTSLIELASLLADSIRAAGAQVTGSGELKIEYKDFRAGDVKHSLANVSSARTQIGFEPTHDLIQGLATAMPWYLANQGLLR
jgi:UDP-N-acetylglucosamine/UDP-N-acetylgalactosamine 4-epimerase